MAELPIVLAGPIVRRVDARSVAVWVAVRAPGTVALHVWEGRQRSAGNAQVASGDQPVASGVARTRRLGGQLHVALVCTGASLESDEVAPITPALRPGAVYSYDIVYTPTIGGGAQGLKALGLLRDDPPQGSTTHSLEGVAPAAPRQLALGYGEDMLPSFVLPAATIPEVKIAHASCRKPHGPGTDALSWLDDEIRKTVEKPGQRIQQLFLTGDQIYADDVATCLLPVIHDLSLDVIGEKDEPSSGEEELPLPSGPARVSLANAPPLRRTRLVRADGGFTSGEAQNHLLTFGEYCATYLLAWSPRVWRALADENRCYEHVASTSPFSLNNLAATYGGSSTPSEAELRERVKSALREEYRKERQRVLVYAATVGKVARVLANTPTYMIFDDHDVTDDWNLNAEWRLRVYSKPLGRALMRNGLLAYTFFQAWGSDWQSFADPGSPNAKLLAAAEAYLAVARGRPADKQAQIDKLLGLDADGGERAKFHYEASGALYKVRVLDSRTRRTYPYSTGVAPPYLLGHGSASTLDDQVPSGPRQSGTEFLIVVTSTPLLGPELLERMIVPPAMQAIDAKHAFWGDPEDEGEEQSSDKNVAKYASRRTRGAMFFDGESWPANERGQQELIARLATYEKVVVLGGDVHYGTNFALDYFYWDRSVGESSRQQARLVQFTSSASRNAFHPTIEAIARSYHWLVLWMFGSAFEGLGWKDQARIKAASDAEPISLLRLARMREKPAMVPAFGWPKGWSIEPGDEPDWAWRLMTLRDTRTERKGPFESAEEQLAPDLAAAAALPPGIERARRAAAAHAKATAMRFAPLRELVLTNNVGIVTFEQRPDGVTASHTLLSTDQSGYPEDEPDDDLASRMPLGDGAHVAAGEPNTVIRVGLEPEGEPPVLHGES